MGYHNVIFLSHWFPSPVPNLPGYQNAYYSPPCLDNTGTQGGRKKNHLGVEPGKPALSAYFSNTFESATKAAMPSSLKG